MKQLGIGEMQVAHLLGCARRSKMILVKHDSKDPSQSRYGDDSNKM